MAKLIECIPNFSEGREAGVVEALAAAARSVPGASLLDYSADASHNRSVFTLLGDPAGVEEAAFRLAEVAVRGIDLRAHAGGHPRMGAMDVCPFVPVKDVDMEECVALSKRLGERLARELFIPVFLYEESAAAEHRRNLAGIRKGQFEGMAEKMKRPEWVPDYGEAAPHPTAGVSAVGARRPLIAFNVNLSTGDVNIADRIAKTVRGSGGGLKYCKAIGVLLEGRGVAQVSMNMVNYEGTPLYRALELIRAEARRYGVAVTGTELIGLAPARALIDCAEYYLQMECFDYDKQVLENHLLR